MFTPLRLLLAAACAIAAIAAPNASADSIAYISGGNINLVTPDGASNIQITAEGGWKLVTQSDDGTIVGEKEGDLFRLSREGRIINAIPRPLGITGITHLALSPNGQVVAISAPSRCGSGSFARICFRTFYAKVDGSGSADSGHEGDETTWLGDGITLNWSYPTAFYRRFGTGEEQTSWFADDESKTLAAGEASPAGDKLVVVRGDNSEQLRFYTMNGPPPAAPTPRCQLGGAAGGAFSDPTWSPDGNRLAWAEGDGIRIRTAPNLADCSGDTSARAIMGASSPDWSAADLPTAGGGGGGGGGDFASSHSARSRIKLGTLLRRGLPVTVQCNASCNFRTLLKLGRLRVGVAFGLVEGDSSSLVRVKLNKRGKRALRARRTSRLKLVVTVRNGTDEFEGSQTIKVTR